MNKIFILTILLAGFSFGQTKKTNTIELQTIDKSTELNKFQEAQNKSILGEISSDKFYEAADEYYQSLESTKGSGYKPYLRAKHKYADKNASETQPDFNAIWKEFKKIEAKQSKAELQAAGEWTEKGPFETPTMVNGSPSILGTGRMNAIEVDPNNSNILWAGAAGGGIWKSTNRGQNWVTFEETNFASLGISDIAISKKNSNVVYAASGDKNSWLSGGSDVRYYSVGLYKTIDGGNSWTVVSPFAQNETSRRNYVTDVEIDPIDDDIIYVSTSEGFFKSENGGNSWSLLLSGYYIDMKLNLGDRSRVHLCRFSNSSTEIVTYDVSSETIISDIPVNSTQRGEIALTEDDTDVAYVLLTANGVFGAVLKSEDAGESWSIRSSFENGINYLGVFNGTGNDRFSGQGLYDLCIAVNPNNADDVIIGGINLWRSQDGARNFQRATSWWQFNITPPFIHADQHELEWDDNGDIFSANDGGIYYTTNNGQNWSDLNTSLHVTQFYRFSSSQQSDRLMIAGAQDNSTWVYDDGEWVDVGVGGDGFHCIINPEDDDVMVASANTNGINNSIGTRILVSNNRGRSFNQYISSANFNEYSQWIAPFEFDPNDTDDLIVGFNNLYKINTQTDEAERLTNNQVSQSQTIRQIDISEINSNHIWYSISGSCFYSSNGGGNWTQIYGGNQVITDIEASTSTVSEVYLTLTGFSSGNKVIKISGSDIENITYNLPNISAYTVVQIPGSNDLYVGMDIGVYKKTENGGSWELFSRGLTRSGISELEFQESSQLLRASTYGRGIWEVPLIDCDIETPVVLANDEEVDITICEGGEVELRYLGDYDRVEWNTGSLKRNITVSESGNYFVTAENNDGCFSISESIEVVVDTIPDVNLATTGVVEVCEKDSVLIGIFGLFDEYEWSDGTTSRNFFAKEEGEYFLTVRDGDAKCEGVSETFEVKIVPAPSQQVIEIENDVLSIENGEYDIQWFRNGEEVDGAISNEISTIFNGEYYAVMTNSDGCETTTESVNVTWFSVTEGDKRGFQVSPNPTDGEINIKYNGISKGNSRIEIVNSLGETIISQDFFASSSTYNETFNLDNFPKGVYFVSLWNKGIRVTEKIVLK